MKRLAPILVALWPCVASAADWMLFDLGTFGGSISYGAAVSNAGYVAGCAQTASGVFHAFVYLNGVMRNLDPDSIGGSCADAVNDNGVAAGRSADGPPVIWSGSSTIPLGVLGTVYGINNAGVAVGGYTVGTTTHAFVYANGMLTDLGASSPPQTFSSAWDVNERGQVVGVIGGQPFLYDAGRLTILPPLAGDGGGSARGINDQGEIVGMASVSNGEPGGFLYDGVMRALPGPTFAGAIAINNRGQVIGSGEGVHGYLIDGGAVIRLDAFKVVADRGWHGLEPTGINDRGWIVGQGFNEANVPRAFLLVPIEAGTGTGAVNPLSRAAPGTRATVVRIP